MFPLRSWMGMWRKYRWPFRGRDLYRTVRKWRSRDYSSHCSLNNARRMVSIGYIVYCGGNIGGHSMDATYTEQHGNGDPRITADTAA